MTSLVRKSAILALPVIAVVTYAGFASGSPSGSVHPVTSLASNPAQLTPNVPDVQQGDLCATFGATTRNREGTAFDCEPSSRDYKLRWIRP